MYKKVFDHAKSIENTSCIYIHTLYSKIITIKSVALFYIFYEIHAYFFAFFSQMRISHKKKAKYFAESILNMQNILLSLFIKFCFKVSSKWFIIS